MNKLYAIITILLSIGQLEISGYPEIHYVDPSYLIDYEDPLEGLVVFLESTKNNPQHKSDELAKAIIDRDVDKVSQMIGSATVAQQEFGILILHKDVSELKELAKINIDERKKIFPEFIKKALDIGALSKETYLSLAILISTFDKTDDEKQKSFKIIELLLANKECCKEDIDGNRLIESFGKRKNNSEKDADFPCMTAQPLLFRCVDLGCRPEILDLLCAHGAKAHLSKSSMWTCDWVDDITVAHFAEQVKSAELLAVLKKWLSLEKFLAEADWQKTFSTWMPFLKTIDGESKWACYKILCELLISHRKVSVKYENSLLLDVFTAVTRDSILRKARDDYRFLKISLELTRKVDQIEVKQVAKSQEIIVPEYWAGKINQKQFAKLTINLAREYELFLGKNTELKRLLRSYCQFSACELNCVLTFMPELADLSQKIKISLD